MARPAMRDPNGPWSLAQIAAAAGVTYRTARTVTGSGYLDAKNLTHRDIPLMRVAAALLDAPRPAGTTRTSAADQVTRRNFDALALAARAVHDPRDNPEATLAVLPSQARLADNAFALMGLVGEFQGQPMLLLPIGAWAIEARNTVSQPPTHQEAV